MADIVYDARDFFRLSSAFGRLPAEIKAKVARRAMGRVASMGATQVVRRISERTDLPYGVVRQRTRSYESAEQAVVRVLSNWISLYDLGARQTRTGVSVRGRGSYAHAFLVHRYEGVFMREGESRLPIRQLYGPNPAHDVVNNRDVYDRLLVDIAARHVLPRMLHELGRVLPR